MRGSRDTRELLKISAKRSKLVAKHRLNFTKKALENLARARTPVYAYDSQARGLAVCIASTGRVVFLLYRRIAGRPERVTIGQFPDMSIRAGARLR